MTKLALTALLTTATVALAAPAKFVLKGDAAKGKATFTMFCVPCHGESGKGDGPAGVALTPKPANFTDKERAAKSTDEMIYNKIKEGGAPFNMSPLMVSWKATLKDQEIRDVAAYIRTFSAGDAKAAPPTPAPAPAPAPKK